MNKFSCLIFFFVCVSVNFQVFGHQKFSMEVENLKNGGLYHLGTLNNKKKKKIEQENQFQHPPSLSFIGKKHHLHFISKSYSLELFSEARSPSGEYSLSILAFVSH